MKKGEGVGQGQELTVGPSILNGAVQECISGSFRHVLQNSE